MESKAFFFLLSCVSLFDAFHAVEVSTCTDNSDATCNAKRALTEDASPADGNALELLQMKSSAKASANPEANRTVLTAREMLNSVIKQLDIAKKARAELHDMKDRSDADGGYSWHTVEAELKKKLAEQPANETTHLQDADEAASHNVDYWRVAARGKWCNNKNGAVKSKKGLAGQNYTQDACQAACKRDRSCKFFSFNKADKGWCTTYTECGQLTETPNGYTQHVMPHAVTYKKDNQQEHMEYILSTLKNFADKPSESIFAGDWQYSFPNLKEAEKKAFQNAAEVIKSQEQAQLKEQADAQAVEEEKAQKEAEEKAKKEAKEKAQLKEQADAQAAEEEKAQKEAEEKAKKEAEEKAIKEAAEQAKKHAKEIAEKAKKEAEEKKRKEAEEKAKKEAEEKTKRKAERKALKDEAERAKKEALEKAKIFSEAHAKMEAEEKSKKEAEERAKKEAAEPSKKQTKPLKKITNPDEKAAEPEEKLEDAKSQAKPSKKEAAEMAPEEMRILPVENEAKPANTESDPAKKVSKAPKPATKEAREKKASQESHAKRQKKLQEFRLDHDGHAYTKQDFLDYYGDLKAWDRAPEAHTKHLKNRDDIVHDVFDQAEEANVHKHLHTVPDDRFYLLAKGKWCNNKDGEKNKDGVAGPGYSLAECKAKCLKKASCAAFSFNSDGSGFCATFLRCGTPTITPHDNHHDSLKETAMWITYEKATVHDDRAKVAEAVKKSKSLNRSHAHMQEVSEPADDFELVAKGKWCDNKGIAVKDPAGIANVGHTLASCKAACAASSTCKSISFNKLETWCTTYLDCGTPTATPTGVKQDTHNWYTFFKKDGKPPSMQEKKPEGKHKMKKEVPTTGACMTNEGATCVFPFAYKGTSYDRCTYVDGKGVAWCATNSADMGWLMGQRPEGAYGACNAACQEAGMVDVNREAEAKAAAKQDKKHEEINAKNRKTLKQIPVEGATASEPTVIESKHEPSESKKQEKKHKEIGAKSRRSLQDQVRHQVDAEHASKHGSSPSLQDQLLNDQIEATSANPLDPVDPEPVELTKEVEVAGGTVCTTVEGSVCLFPFVYQGITYNKCTTEGDRKGIEWCATKMDSPEWLQGRAGKGEWGYCQTCKGKIDDAA